MTHSRRFVAMVACCVAASIAVVGQAWGGKAFHESYHDEGSFVRQNFCGSAGLTVSVDFVVDGRVHAVQRADGFEYVVDHIKETEVYTANGKTVTFVFRGIREKDLRKTDNGDGTLTFLKMLVGQDVLYGPDGKVIARNPGQSRFELLIDHGGTPSDPSDDELISEQVVKRTPSVNDDLCAAFVEAVT
jgi:hypothetical protein